MKVFLNSINSRNEFEIVEFEDKMFQTIPVEEWPRVDCLIAFYSNGKNNLQLNFQGFPLNKVIQYQKLYPTMFSFNDLPSQHLLFDRRGIYHLLQVGSHFR